MVYNCFSIIIMRMRGKYYQGLLVLVGSVVIQQMSYALEPTLDEMTVRHPIHIRRPIQSLVTPFVPSGLSPSQIRAAYNLPTTGGSGTIALIDAYNDPSCQNDFNVFSQQYGLPTASTTNFEIHKMSATIAGNEDWGGEISLDVQWAHAIAPNAKILLVEAKSNSNANLLAAVDYARDRADVVAVSMSWGGSEFSTEASNDTCFISAFGANFFASSGDDGTGVEWPAASVDVTGVGGTELIFNGNVVSMETAWNDSGGGLSAYVTEPSYQTNYGVKSTFGRRAVPDVSYNGGPDSAVAVYDSYGYGGWLEVWGTSAGSPQWAAIRSLGGTIVNNTTFYARASTLSTYTVTFRDITIGNNMVSGSPGFYTETTVGYDYVTGLGSPLTYTFTFSSSGTLIASFSTNLLDTYGPLTVKFTDTSQGLQGSSTTWSWTFGDGSTSSAQNPQHIYQPVSAPTTYTVFEIVSTSFGMSTASTTITVTEAGPIASFNKNLVNTYGPLTINFMDTSQGLQGNSTTWSWVFGDGNTSNAQNPQHVYLSVPTTTQYVVQLIVTTPFGTSTSGTQTVTVTEAGPSASFSKNIVNTYGPLTVNFTDTSNSLNGNSTTWSWTFGDGSTSSAQSPQHIYLSGPTTSQYIVQLIVTTPFGVSSSVTQTVTVTEAGPSASFSKSIVNTYGPLTVNFTDTSNSLNGNSTTWSWTFGDGSTSSAQSPQHIYLSVPTTTQYTIQLVVTTPFGVSSSVTQTVTVTEAGPSASFSKSIVNTYGPLTVNFTDTSNSLNGNSTTWSWTFGDGSTSNTQNPQHVYLSVPTTTQYTIQLVVTTPFGVSSSVTQTVTVTEAGPSASFSKSIVNTYGPLTVNFTDTSNSLNGNSTTWSWTFGDGSTSSAQSPQHIYLSVPTTTQYTIQLVVTTPFGVSSSVTQTVTVTESGPSASFSKSIVNTYGPLTVNFTDTSSLLNGNSTTWLWSFGDKSTSSAQSPQHIYLSVPTTTQYTIQLVVTTPFGVSSSVTQTVTVTESGPSASFSKSIVNTYGPLTVNFTDTSSLLNGNSTTWLWSFGDKSTSNVQNPQHVYLSVPTTTKYTVKLIVTTPFGTSTSATQTVTVKEAGPKASFSESLVNTYGPLTVNFKDTSSRLNGNSTTWLWTFGDGSTSNVQNPQHVYLSVLTTTQYVVQLIVTTPFGASTSATKTVTVTEAGPKASFSESLVNTYGPLTVNFMDTSSPLNGNSTTWLWTFGDGSTSNVQNPQHVYPSVQTITKCTVKLVVTTLFGVSTSATQIVTVSEAGPIAAFSPSATSGNGPLTVNFMDQSNNLNGNSTTWSWNFGDGKTSTKQSPSHIYATVAAPTSYTARLIVKTPFGTSTAKQNISVTEPPPSVPLLITPLNNLTTNIHEQFFSWSTSTDALGSSINYNLQLGLDSAFSSIVTTINSISTTTQTVSGLPNGMIYGQVQATSLFGTTGSAIWQILVFDTTDQRVVASSETVTFYVGDTTGVYLPVQIFFTSTDADTVTVTNVNTTAPNLPTGQYIPRYWIITPAVTQSNLTATITFSYTSSDYLASGLALESDLVPAWDTTGLGGWSFITSGVTVDTVNHLLTVSDVTHFSNWTLGGDNGEIPDALSNPTVKNDDSDLPK